MSSALVDRYVTFNNIDCDGNARRVVERVRMHVAQPGGNNRYWEQFEAKLAGRAGMRADELLVVHASIHVIRELFEQMQDGEGLTLLQQLEEECC